MVRSAGSARFESGNAAQAPVQVDSRDVPRPACDRIRATGLCDDYDEPQPHLHARTTT